MKRYYDQEVLDVLSRLYGREKSPEVILNIIGELTNQKGKAQEALSYIYEGLGFAESLRRAELISEEAYFFLSSAEKAKVLKDFVQEYRNIKRRMGEVKKKFLSAMYSPIMAFVVSLVVFYIFVYRVIPQMNLPEEKALQVLPFYFKFIFFMSENLMVYFLLVGGMVLGLLALYLLRRRIGFIERLYGLYERLKLYAHIHLATSAGYKIEDALEKYKGALSSQVKAIKEMNLEGVPLQTAFIEALNIQDPVEKALLRGALLASRSELAKSMKEFYDEIFDMFIFRLSAMSEVVRLISLLVVGLVLVFTYGFIFLPLLNAMRSIMM